MSEHGASIRWAAEGDFRAGRYNRRHEIAFDGGVTITASASPAIVRPPLSDPAGVDPEEMLVAAVASCHMLWFLDLAHRAGHDLAAYRDEAVGELGQTPAGKIAVTRITLRPALTFADAAPDAAEIDRLHHEAHERCFIANSLNSEIVVAPQGG